MKQWNKKDFEYWKSVYAQQNFAQQSIVEQNAMVDLAKSLLARISGDVNTSASVQPNVTSLSTLGVSADKPIELKAENLVNLRTLVGYLATENVAWKGQLIAGIKGKKQDPIKGGAQDVDTLTSKVNPNDLKNYKNFPNTTHLFVNAEALKSYLIDLKNKADKSGNQLFIVMVDSIITEANKIYAFNIKDTSEVESFDGELIIDQLPKLIDLNNLKSTGPILLKLKDIATPNDLTNWLKSNQVSITNGKLTELVDDVKAICKLIGYLWTRSKNLNVKLTKEGNEYTKRIEGLGKLYSCPVGTGKESIETSDQKIPESSVSSGVQKVLSTWTFPLMENKFSRTQVFNFINSAFALLNILSENAKASKSDQELLSILNGSIDLKNKLTEIKNNLADMETLAKKNWNELRLDTGIPNISEAIYREKISAASDNPMLAAKKTVLAVIQCIDNIQEILDGFKNFPILEKTFDESKIANQLQLANYQTNILRNVYDTGLDNLNAKLVGKK